MPRCRGKVFFFKMDRTLGQTNGLKEFDDHKLVIFLSDSKTGLLGFLAIHRGNSKYPAFGATRIWSYPSSESALIDALRLSKTMSYKAALSGLKCGGGKAVLFLGNSSRLSSRDGFLKSYATRVNFLAGHFITGADVGVSRKDVILMRRYSPYFVGVMTDPVRFTGLGILLSIRVCLKEVFGTDSLLGRSFAVQGVGKVGQELIKRIYPHTQDIVVADIDPSAVAAVKEKYPRVKVVDPKEILKQKVDVLSPCALSNCLNNVNIRRLNCVIVAGGANSQLESDKIADKIHKMGILHAPDYIANAGGLISVFDEYEYGNYRINRIENRVGIIRKNMERVIAQSKKTKKSPMEVANQMAREIFDNLV